MGSTPLYGRSERSAAPDAATPQALTDQLCALLPAEGLDAAVLVAELGEGRFPLLPRLEALRHRLPEKGLLLVATPASGLRELTIGLSESGFALPQAAVVGGGRAGGCA